MQQLAGEQQRLLVQLQAGGMREQHLQAQLVEANAALAELRLNTSAQLSRQQPPPKSPLALLVPPVCARIGISNASAAAADQAATQEGRTSEEEANPLSKELCGVQAEVRGCRVCAACWLQASGSM